MHYNAILLALGLATSVSAVDVYLWTGACYGQGMACTNWNPNVCCSGPGEYFLHAGARAIPSGWKLQIRGHSGGGCANTKYTQVFTGPADMCITNGYFSGVGYGFVSKRGIEAADTCSADTCKQSQAADQAIFADGAKYDVSSMSKELHDEMVALIVGGQNSTAVPAHFSSYLVN